MVANNEGLTRRTTASTTRTSVGGILRLRELHDAMDRTVLDAYGWGDIRPRCEFLLDYEEEEDEDGKPSTAQEALALTAGRRRRDEVLARRPTTSTASGAEIRAPLRRRARETHQDPRPPEGGGAR